MGGIARRARRQALHTAGLPAKGHSVNDLGMVKMSDILLHVAEPLLRDLEMPEQEELFRRALALASTIWNASRFPAAAAREAAFAEVLQLLGEPVEQEVERMLRKTFRRASLLYPNDPRTIANAELYVGPDGKFHVTALSVLPHPSAGMG